MCLSKCGTCALNCRAGCQVLVGPGGLLGRRGWEDYGGVDGDGGDVDDPGVVFVTGDEADAFGLGEDWG